MIKNEVLLQDLCALGAVGGNPFDYFEDIGVKEVALYGNDDLVSIVWAYGYWSKVKVKYVFGNEDKEVDVYTGEKIRSSKLHIGLEKPPINMPLIVCESLKTSAEKAIHLKKLITYSRMKRLLLDNVLDYKLENPGVTVVLLGLPALSMVKDKSRYERKLFLTPGMSIIEKNQVINYLSTCIQEDGSGEKVLEDAKFNTVKHQDVYFLEEKSSEYVNVENGYRKVPNIPQRYSHTVYTFGNSLCMGMYTDDQHTMQFQLQKRLNEYQENRTLYAKNRGGGIGF